MPWESVQTSEHGVTKYWIDNAERIVTVYEIKKDVNKWYIIFNADENGKIEINGIKKLGRIGKGEQFGTESTLTFRLQTTNDRLPKFRPIYNTGDSNFVELDDRKNRTNEAYKKYEDYNTRQYPESSVLTVYEFISEAIPDLEKLLADKTFDGYVSKISEQVSQLQAPHNKVYTNLVK